jgi:hypothetical protein
MLKDKVYTENPHTEDMKESIQDVEFQVPRSRPGVPVIWCVYKPKETIYNIFFKYGQ